MSGIMGCSGDARHVSSNSELSWKVARMTKFRRALTSHRGKHTKSLKLFRGFIFAPDLASRPSLGSDSAL